MLQKKLRIQLIRNATVCLSLGETTLLIDPMFAPKGTLDPIPWSNETRNPTAELPLDPAALQQLISDTNLVLLTHSHPDHWDTVAQQLLPKKLPIVCQPEDAAMLHSQGFNELLTVSDVSPLQELRIIRVPAQHGHGELAEQMAPASGYVLFWETAVVYLTGDTVWCPAVQQAIERYQPDVVIVNSGAAQFNFGEPITMTAEDVLQVSSVVKPKAVVVAVHLEAVNHCTLSRQALRRCLSEAGRERQCLVPDDGSIITLHV